jgi:hypothetical protein
MNWDYIIGEVWVLFVKIVAVILAYKVAKYTTTVRDVPRQKPSRLKKVWHYTICLAIVAVIAGVITTAVSNDRDEDGNVIEENKFYRVDENRMVEEVTFKERLAKAFIVLIVPTFVGVAAGHATKGKAIKDGDINIYTVSEGWYDRSDIA